MRLKAAFFLFAFFQLAFFISSAQSITGNILDTASKKEISNAVIALLTPGDSTLYKFTRTTSEGKFEIKNAAAGKYILMVTHPYYANYIDDITVTGTGLDLKQIAIISKSQLLQEVIVKSGSPIKIKGDTTEYTADSFQVKANANVEELLKRLPGIQVSKDGTIIAMGEKVTKVLVDGEEFFGDDPGIAVKNLRADAVDKVQVFDKKSDQATFTGIDDGVKDKTINLKLKDDKKKGYFGKVSGSGGLPDNYNNSAMINAFKKKRKLAAYGIMSNTGQTNLDWRDQTNYGGGSDNMTIEDNGDVYFSGNGDGEDNYRGGVNGIPENLNGGLHYSDKFNNNKTSVNSGYKYSKIKAEGNTAVFSKIFLPDTSYNIASINNTSSVKTKHALNFTYEVMIDSFNSVKWTAKGNNSYNQTASDYVSQTLDNNGQYTNNSNRSSSNTADNTAFNSTLLWKHKFKKLFRTFSLNADFNRTESKNNGYLLSYNNYYKGGVVDRRDTIDQKNVKNGDITGLNSKLAYTEPLFKDAFMEFSYTFSAFKNSNNRVTSGIDASGIYQDVIDSLSNEYSFDRMINKPGLNFRYNKKKVSYALGSSLAFNHNLQKDLTKDTAYNYNFINYFPTAMINYKMKGNKNFRFNYNGSANAPTLEQLQPTKDNSDPLNIYEGNPDLVQSFRHNINVSYNFYNVLKEKGLWSSLQYSITNNAFVRSTILTDSTGARRYKTVNANGVHNLNFYLDYNFKLNGSGFRLNFSPNFNNSQNIDFIQNDKNTNTTTSYGMGVGISKYVENKYEFSVRPNFSYNHSTSDLNTNANADFWLLSGWVNGSVTLPLKLELNTDMRVEVRQKDPRFTSKSNYALWNASLNKKLMKNKLEAGFSVNDLLNQNRGFRRDFSSSSFTETYYNTLRRYWMVTVTWNFSSNGAKPQDF